HFRLPSQHHTNFHSPYKYPLMVFLHRSELELVVVVDVLLIFPHAICRSARDGSRESNHRKPGYDSTASKATRFITITV
ncbi:hypothetical protein A2U01_0056155, partial [Trifolium medium]|nr:hypothetical protein [Trifolium medium]